MGQYAVAYKKSRYQLDDACLEEVSIIADDQPWYLATTPLWLLITDIIEKVNVYSRSALFFYGTTSGIVIYIM